MTRIALIIAGGSRPDPHVVGALPPVDFCVAADGGADSARQIGIGVDAVVGDMDSISATELALLNDEGVEITRYPSDKEQTDLELAFQRAMEEQPDRLLVIGIGGGRLDHELANMALLASPAYADVAVDGLVGSARLAVVRGTRTLDGALGETISLMAVQGPAEGVSTEGLEYALRDERLDVGSTRGISNRFVASTATITVGHGVVLAVQPHALKDRGVGLIGGMNGHGVRSGDYEGGKDQGA